ncbi:MAG: Glu-tRNA(Gln) amidotransferase subunit GatD [Thermoplasmatales archaeon]|nr:Glu-tRNA(Gln) amidotransferase subunit GatD [Thermoplasmatales archaeon]
MIEPGDLVEIRKGNNVYKGIVMPHHSFSGKNIMVIKLENGYNVGINIKNCEIKLIEKSREKEIEKKEIFCREEKPEIAIIGTGGTIASYVDYETGAVHPATTAEEISISVPEIFEICNIEAKILFQKFSENIKPRDWRKIAREVAKFLNSGKKGVIVTHGTDTMSYTSASLAFMLKNLNGPVVFTGSQRSSDRPSSDAFLNLISSAKVSTTDLGEVVVVMHRNISGEIAIHRATKVRKMHSSRRDAFISVNSSPIGYVNEEVVFTQPYNKRKDGKVKVKDRLNENVCLIYYYPGLSKKYFEKIVDGKDGVVIAGTGLGHISEELIPSIKKLTSKGIPVVITTQCLWGSVNLNVYATGRKLLKAGVIDGKDMLPEVAYIKLMWVLKNEKNLEEAMQRNIAGEISEKRCVKDFLGK